VPIVPLGSCDLERPERLESRRTAKLSAPITVLRGDSPVREDCGVSLDATAQGAKFGAGQWVDGRDPIFKSIDVQAAMDEIGLLPAQRT
jgi:hypothetical protein